MAAVRPLEVDELKEALAVVPGDTKWKSDHQVNNIYHTLACCESLMIVAEEERTVHFVHQSVVQFLLDQKSTSTALRFDLAQSSLGLGEVCVTYLNYAIFDQRVSRTVVPTIQAGTIPTKIAQDTLQGTGLVGQLALKLLNFQSTNGPNLGQILTETTHINRKRQENAGFEFLKYASRHWLIHTSRIDHTHSTFSLWKGLLQQSRFDGLVWGPNEIQPETLLVDEKSGIIWTLAPRVTWAISHSHLSLLLLELRSRWGLKAFSSIIPYIRVLLKAGDKLKVDDAMALKLLEVAAVAGADDIARLILFWTYPTISSCPREAFIDAFVKRGDLEKVIWIIGMPGFGERGLSGLSYPIVEVACRARNLELLSYVLEFGARVDLYDQNPLLLLVEEMRDSVDLALACCLVKAGFPLNSCDGMEQRLYWFLLQFAPTYDLGNFHPSRNNTYSLGAHKSISATNCENLIRRACERAFKAVSLEMDFGIAEEFFLENPSIPRFEKSSQRDFPKRNYFKTKSISMQTNGHNS